jgi:hypothetical protein
MPVSEAEFAALVAIRDISAVGARADEARRSRHRRRTTFVRVAVVPAEPSAPLAWPREAGEVRVLGVPSSPAAAVARIAQVVRRAAAVPVSAFSLADLELFAGRERLTLRRLLEDLRAAGLDMVSDAPIDLVRDARRAVEEVNIAGLGLARLTVHRLSRADAPALFRRVADLQRAVGVIRVFAPFPRTASFTAAASGCDELRYVALARLIVDNVASIQVDWSRYGPKLTQIALTMGADDVEDPCADGNEEGTSTDELRRRVRAAGQDAVERNGRFDMLA